MKLMTAMIMMIYKYNWVESGKILSKLYCLKKQLSVQKSDVLAPPKEILLHIFSLNPGTLHICGN